MVAGRREPRRRKKPSHDEWARECMKRDGWYAHYVGSGEPCSECGTEGHEHSGRGVPWPAYLANAHTHGLPESAGHPDFQIVLAMDPRTISGLFAELAERIRKENAVYGEGVHTGLVRWSDPVRQLRDPMRCRMVLVNEAPASRGGAKVLRILLPDVEGRLPGEPECDPIYESQAAFDSDA